VVAIRDVINEKFEIVAETTTLFDITVSMHSHRASVFLVASGGQPVSVQDVKGVISKERIADVMTETVVLARQ
jgi:hypothetical protein